MAAPAETMRYILYVRFCHTHIAHPNAFKNHANSGGKSKQKTSAGGDGNAMARSILILGLSTYCAEIKI